MAVFSSFHRQPHKAAKIFSSQLQYTTSFFTPFQHNTLPPSKALFALITLRSNFFNMKKHQKKQNILTGMYKETEVKLDGNLASKTRQELKITTETYSKKSRFRTDHFINDNRPFKLLGPFMRLVIFKAQNKPKSDAFLLSSEVLQRTTYSLYM